MGCEGLEMEVEHGTISRDFWWIFWISRGQLLGKLNISMGFDRVLGHFHGMIMAFNGYFHGNIVGESMNGDIPGVTMEGECAILLRRVNFLETIQSKAPVMFVGL